MFASSISPPGQVLSPADICLLLTPPAVTPTPFPNIGMMSMSQGFVQKVLICTMFALNLGSSVSMTNGDEPGMSGGGGVVSHMVKGSANFTSGSTKVFMGGQPAVRLSSSTTQNNNNCVGLVISPSQCQVIVK